MNDIIALLAAALLMLSALCTIALWSAVVVSGRISGDEEAIVGNPPFAATYQRVKRIVSVPCPNCLGGGTVPTSHGPKKCPVCEGSGDVERWLNEIVTDEQEQEGGKA